MRTPPGPIIARLPLRASTTSIATTTHYRTAETFTGLLVPLVLAVYRQRLQTGFTACATALHTHLTQPHPH